MKRIVLLLALSALNVISSAARPAARNAAVEAVIAASPSMRGAVVSVMAVSASGDTLVNIDCERRLLPASNMKLVSTGAALHHFGADWRFRTSIGIDGEVREGVLKGDIHIIGGGDPTLGSLDSICPPAETAFALWKSFLDARGIRRIEGRVIGDGSAFDGMREHPSWSWEDLGSYYGQGSSGLNFCENFLRFNVRPGAKVGDPIRLTQLYPKTPWLKIEDEASTGVPGSGDELYFYTTDFSPKALMRGTYAVDKKPKVLCRANKQPELSCATEFLKYLNSNGIAGGTAVGAPKGTGRCELEILGESESVPLSRIARFTNVDSNNLFAECLFRSLGRDLCGSACYDSCAVAICKVLGSLGLGNTSAHIVDGSGLSRKNYLSPSFFCRFLSAMMDSPAWEPFLASLPHPAAEGTLRKGFGNLPEELRKRISMKSGSMNGVRCYSGYYIPESGEATIFSVMVNNCTASNAELTRVSSAIIAAILL